MYFIVPAHLQGENKGLRGSYSSERQILQRGELPEAMEGSLITNGTDFAASSITPSFLIYSWHF